MLLPCACAMASLFSWTSQELCGIIPSPVCVQARPPSSRAVNGAVQLQGAESERAGVVTQPASLSPGAAAVWGHSMSPGVPCMCCHLGRGQGEPLLAFPSPGEPVGIKLE